MWTPLSKIKNSTGELHFSHYAITTCSGLSILILQTITSWAYVEAGLGVVMAKFLGAKSDAAASMYSAINGFHAQKNALKAVAHHTLSGSDKDLFDDAIDSVSSIAKIRHHFAHWLWGTCSTLQGSLLLVEPRHIWKYHARAETLKATGDIKITKDFPEFDRSKVQVWSPDALMQARMAMDEAADIVNAVSSYFMSDNDAERSRILHQLYSLDQIRRARQKRLKQS